MPRRYVEAKSDPDPTGLHRAVGIGAEAADALNQSGPAVVQQRLHVEGLRARCDRGAATAAELRELEREELKLARMQGRAAEARRALEVTAAMCRPQS